MDATTLREQLVVLRWTPIIIYRMGDDRVTTRQWELRDFDVVVYDVPGVARLYIALNRIRAVERVDA